MSMYIYVSKEGRKIPELSGYVTTMILTKGFETDIFIYILEHFQKTSAFQLDLAMLLFSYNCFSFL